MVSFNSAYYKIEQACEATSFFSAAHRKFSMCDCIWWYCPYKEIWGKIWKINLFIRVNNIFLSFCDNFNTSVKSILYVDGNVVISSR